MEYNHRIKNDHSVQSMVNKINLEMLGKKLGKMEMNLAELRRENAKLREEIGLKNREFERQFAKMNAEIAKLKGGNNRVSAWQIQEEEADETVCS